MELAKKLLAHAVGYMMDGCGNSYVNAYMENWLNGAKRLGAYPSWMPTVGKIVERKEKWEEYLDKRDGLPELDDLRKSGGKTIRVMRAGRPATEEEIQSAVEGRPLPEVFPPLRIGALRLRELDPGQEGERLFALEGEPFALDADKRDKRDIRAENLAALCQKCHLNHDRDEHRENTRHNREARRLAAEPMLPAF